MASTKRGICIKILSPLVCCGKESGRSADSNRGDVTLKTRISRSCVVDSVKFPQLFPPCCVLPSHKAPTQSSSSSNSPLCLVTGGSDGPENAKKDEGKWEKDAVGGSGSGRVFKLDVEKREGSIGWGWKIGAERRGTAVCRAGGWCVHQTRSRLSENN